MNRLPGSFRLAIASRADQGRKIAMRCWNLIVALCTPVVMLPANAQASGPVVNPAIDVAAYLRVSKQALDHRETHRLSESDFIRISRESGTVRARCPEQVTETSTSSGRSSTSTLPRSSSNRRCRRGEYDTGQRARVECMTPAGFRRIKTGTSSGDHRPRGGSRARTGRPRSSQDWAGCRGSPWTVAPIASCAR
jgi:hypothetical protein